MTEDRGEAVGRQQAVCPAQQRLGVGRSDALVNGAIEGAELELQLTGENQCLACEPAFLTAFLTAFLADAIGVGGGARGCRRVSTPACAVTD